MGQEKLLKLLSHCVPFYSLLFDFCSFFTGGTSPSPLADFLDFHFGRMGVTSSSLTSLSFVAIEGSVGGLDCLADFSF